MAVSKVIKFHPYAQVRNQVSIGAKIRKLINLVRRRMAMRSAVRELSKLSDHHLRDIGLERNTIYAAVYGDHEMKNRNASKTYKEKKNVRVEEIDRLAA